LNLAHSVRCLPFRFRELVYLYVSELWEQALSETVEWDFDADALICQFGRKICEQEGRDREGRRGTVDDLEFVADVCKDMEMMPEQYDRLLRAWRSICAVNEELWQAARGELTKVESEHKV
jgi:hypothetical protein